jgi:hypothetical protein
VEIGAVLATVVPIVVGAAGALVSGFLRRSERREVVARRQIEDDTLETALERVLGRPLSLDETKLLIGPSSGVTEQAPQVADEETKTEINAEVESLVSTFKERLERIEQRFPAQATPEKVASTNDAIMATKLEYLEKSLDKVQDRQLSRWDVALVLFAILGGLGALIGIILGIGKLTGH